MLVCVHSYVHMYISIYIYTYIYIHTYTYRYIYTHTLTDTYIIIIMIIIVIIIIRVYVGVEACFSRANQLFWPIFLVILALDRQSPSWHVNKMHILTCIISLARQHISNLVHCSNWRPNASTLRSRPLRSRPDGNTYYGTCPCFIALTDIIALNVNDLWMSSIGACLLDFHTSIANWSKSRASPLCRE